MLTTCALVLLSLTGLRAQTFTQVGYNFPSAPDVATDATTSCSLPLTMNSLACDGYGQWSSFDAGDGGDWVLLGNHLENPNSGCTYHGGVVQSGEFNPFPNANSGEVRITANLQGSVLYVWPDPTNRDQFIVEAFTGPNFGAAIDNVDLWFVNGSSGMTLSAPASTLPVKPPIYEYTTPVSTFWTGDGNFHPPVSSPTELERDILDVACDESNLYIVWEDFSMGQFNIFETTMDITDGVSWYGPQKIGHGTRPTIAADVRASGGEFLASFDVAWIKGPSADKICWVSCQNNTIEPTVELTNFMLHPGHSTDSYSKAFHARVLVGSALGATPSPNGPRAIYGSVEDLSNPGFAHLIFYPDIQRYLPTWATPDPAIYVDGSWLAILHTPPVDGIFPVDIDPIVAFANPYDGQGQAPPLSPGTTPFNEYHCLYRIHRNYVDGTLQFHHDPLMIVRGADVVGTTNAMNQCLNVPNLLSTIDRPDALHSFSEDPNDDGVSYIGAVNQMGIHCHWRNGADHFYMRDARAFDEPIEEYTLETNATTVQDGTSHQSTYTNFPTRTMDERFVPIVLWGEPTAMEFENHPGSTTHDPVLNFMGTNAELLIGAPLANEGIFADLITFPTFKVNFNDASQLLLLDNGSLFDYYGNSIPGSLEHFSFSGAGSSLPTVQLNGEAATLSVPAIGFPTSLTGAATLNIHGGCGFTTTTAINFVALNSNINCIHEQETGTSPSLGDLYTICAGPITFNTCATGDGFDFCAGPQTITECIIRGGTTGGPSLEPDIIQVHPCAMTCGSTQFSLTNSLVQNRGTSQGVECLFTGNTTGTACSTLSSACYHAINISGGEFDAAALVFQEPQDFITIANTTFDNINGHETDANAQYGCAADFSLTMSTVDYSLITVAGCSFLNWQYPTPLLDVPLGQAPLSFNNFASVNAIDPTQIVVEDNNFPSDGTEPFEGVVGAAIYFRRTCGTIGDNTIMSVPPIPPSTTTYGKYQYGIWLDGVDKTYGNLPSFICNNDIEDITEPITAYSYYGPNDGAAGLFYSYYDGYSTMNAVINCFVGQLSNGNDVGHVIFSSYLNNLSYGMWTLTGTDEPDLTGVHHPLGIGDIAAFNTITGNNSAGSFYGPRGTQIMCMSGPTSSPIDLGVPFGKTWTVFGDNDIEGAEDVEGFITAYYSLWDVDNNFWGGGDIATNLAYTTTPHSYIHHLSELALN